MSEKGVPVALPDGTPGYAPAPVAKQVVAEGGRRMSVAEAASIEKQIARDEKYDPTKHPLNAIGSLYGGAYASYLSGVTGGLSDVAIAKGGDALGVDGRGFLNDFRENHPLLHASENLSGFAGSAAVGGEALGIGEAGSVAGRIAQGAARGGVEMSLYEGGKAASDAALGNEEITAQKMYAGAKHGLVTGIIGGAAFSALGEGLAAGRSQLARRPTVASGIAPVEAEAEASGGRLSKLGDKAAEARDEAYLRAMGGSKGDVRGLNRLDGGYRRVMQDTREVVSDITGGKVMPTREEMHTAIREGLDQMTEKKFGMLDKLDAAKTTGPSVGNVKQRIIDEIITPNTDGLGVAKFGSEKEVATARAAMERLDAGYANRAPTFRDWSDGITGFQKEINYAKQQGDPVHGTLKKISGILNDELDASGEAAAQGLGEAFKDEYRANQKVLQSLIKAQDIVERGKSAFSNNAVGLTARLAGMAGAGVGAVVGGPVGGLAGGVASGLAGKVIQDRGDLLAAELFDRVAGVLGARRVAGRADAAIESGVKGLLGREASVVEGAAAPKKGDPDWVFTRKHVGRERYDQIRASVVEMRGNPVATSNKIEKLVGDAATPKLTGAMVQTALRGLQFLATKLPPTRSDPYSIQPQLDKGRKASDAEVAKFLRYANAVDDPTSVLREAKRGTLTRDQVEAVKTVYPDVYEQMRVAVMQNVISTTHPLPYERKIQLGILLDIPTDRTLAPDFVRAMQASYSAPAPDGEEPHPNLASLDVASSFATPMQSASMEGLER